MANYRAPQGPDIRNELMQALQGEYEAIHIYDKLASMAPNDNIRNVILEIKKDEQRHFRFFTQLLNRWYGLGFHPGEVTLPTSFDKGVIDSFIDEQETVDFYNDLSEKINDPVIKMELRRIAADEQNHAVWFLFFYRH